MQGVNFRVLSADMEAKVQGGLGWVPSGTHKRSLFQTSASSTFSDIPPPKRFPGTQQIPVMNFRADPAVGAGGFGRRRCGPTGRIQAQSLCKQDIRLCQKDQTSLEVFLHSLSLPPSPPSLYLVLAVSRRLLPSKQEDMAAGETQLYAKVSNKLKGRNTSSLLDPLLAMGFPTHTA